MTADKFFGVAEPIALALGKFIRFMIYFGRWIIVAGLIVFLAIYIRKKNKKRGKKNES